MSYISTPAAVAAPSHHYEFCFVAASIMNPNYSLSYPLQYLQAPLQALKAFTTGSPAIADPETSTVSMESSEDEHNTEKEFALPSKAALPPAAVSAINSKPIPVPRPKTSLQLAHPPPASKHKHRLKVRPRLLLQLRQISDKARPVPAFDILPSILFTSKLARRFSRILNGRTGLGVDDLVIVKSQTYDRSHKLERGVDESSDEEGWENREVIAAICQTNKSENELPDQTDICLSDGPPWIASSLGNGGYEFISLDNNGQKKIARWIPRSNHHDRRRASSNPNNMTRTVHSTEKKFHFSILTPGVRRHPVIASLDRISIDIFDHYMIPMTPLGTSTPNSPAAASYISDSSYESYFNSSSMPPVQTNAYLKTLIMVTGVWVAFVEGWSENFKYDKDMSASRSSFSSHSPLKRRGNSARLDACIENRAPTPQSFASARSRYASLNILHRPSTSMGRTSPNPDSVRSRQRADSLGAPFLQPIRNQSLDLADPSNGICAEDPVAGHDAYPALAKPPEQYNEFVLPEPPKTYESTEHKLSNAHKDELSHLNSNGLLQADYRTPSTSMDADRGHYNLDTSQLVAVGGSVSTTPKVKKLGNLNRWRSVFSKKKK
ncbi:MAG: hypothetical protein Q9187_005901 [Circinaria calcarea]